jgi:hypothetical protein
MQIINNVCYFSTTEEKYMSSVFTKYNTEVIGEFDGDFVISINNTYQITLTTMNNILEDKTFTLADFDLYKLPDETCLDHVQKPVLEQVPVQVEQVPVQVEQVHEQVLGQVEQVHEQVLEQSKHDALKAKIAASVKITPKIINELFDSDEDTLFLATHLDNASDVILMLQYLDNEELERSIVDMLMVKKQTLTISQLYELETMYPSREEIREHIYGRLRAMDQIDNTVAIHAACDDKLPEDIHTKFFD